MKIFIWMGFWLLNLLMCQNICLAQDLSKSYESATPQTTCDATVNTGTIGTIETPTIEGGWINLAADHAVIKTPMMLSRLDLKNNKDIKTAISTEKTFDDTWVRTDNLKALFAEATKDNKLATVLHKTTRLKLPSSLALIPMVESGYRTHAISFKGAAGAWQLMPKTASRYGLSNSDRFSFSLSTDVALQLLRDLYARFHNWELVFAAYHAGSKRVLCALRCYPHAIHLADLHLPQETNQYVNRLRALHHALSTLDLFHCEYHGDPR